MKLIPAYIIAIALVFVACQKETPGNIDDINDDWGKKAKDLTTKLTDAQQRSTELNIALTAPAWLSTDSAVMAERTIIEGELRNQEKQIGEVETLRKEMDAERERTLKGGDKTEYEQAWKTALPKYDGAIATLDALEKQQRDLDGRIKKVGSITTDGAPQHDATNGGDTAVVIDKDSAGIR